MTNEERFAHLEARMAAHERRSKEMDDKVSKLISDTAIMVELLRDIRGGATLLLSLGKILKWILGFIAIIYGILGIASAWRTGQIPPFVKIN